MDCEKDLSKFCKPLFVKLTRLSNLEINKYKQGIKHSDRPYSRRRILNAWQRGDCRYLKSQKNRHARKRTTRSDTDDESSEFQVSDDVHNMTSLNTYEVVNSTDVAVHEIQSELIDSAVMLPKNNMTISDKIAWKYKRKQRRMSQSFNKIVRMNESNGDSENISELNNLNSPQEPHEIIQVDLCKEIKIVSSRLEDSDDPQVEKWRSKKKTSASPKPKPRLPRLPPKLYSLDCTVCSVVFDSKEQLSNHIFKHTQRELQDAYKAAKTKLRENESNGDMGHDSANEADDLCDVELSKTDQSVNMESLARKQIPQVTPALSLPTDTLTKVSSSVSMTICSCHAEPHSQKDASVQIEMVLYCETCHVLFRRSECFETHYRFSSICNADRTKGRTPKLFCSTCRVILNTLSNMRRHLEEHASINFHGTVTFVCNICRVVFFGVGTVFCTHWFNHEKDPTFVASRYSFPKLCVSTQGTRPAGSTPDEQYFFVAEYVCRSCKFQFSSECELTNHIEKDCKGVATVKSSVQSKSVGLKSITSTSEPSKMGSETNASKNDAVPVKPLDMINKWICEFCNECYSSRNAFEEHSSKHLQDDGYPGYSCVFQLNASTAFICNVCRGVHNTLQDLMKHWVTHEVIKFICTACNEKCSSYNSFEAHISLACWKSKPDCRVWFNRQQHSCKICKSMYKTPDELAHHYASDHVVEIGTNVSIVAPTASQPIVETPPASETSIDLQYAGKSLNKIANVKSPQSTENQTAFMNLSHHIAAVSSNNQSVAPDVECSISKKSPLQNLSTIKITIPNSLEQSSTLCRTGSSTDPSTFSSSTQNKMISGNCKSTNATSSINLSNETYINASDSLMITKTLGSSQSLESCKTAINITIEDKSSNGSIVMTTSTANLTSGVEDNAGLKQMNMGDLNSFQSIPTASIKFGSPITSNLSNDISLVVDMSQLSRKHDTVAISTKPMSVNNVSTTADKELGISESDEPEIIEIPHNLIVTSNSVEPNQFSNEPEIIPLEKCKLENNSGLPNVRPLVQHKNIRSSVIESANKMGQCLVDSEVSKPRGFLRVKKFTELQAVKNYVCNLCAAAFDNVMSLDEHTIAHNRPANENGKHPTMMAALILPQVDSNKVGIESSAPTTLPTIAQMAGKRTLPYIPQRVINANGRIANPLARGLTSNKSHTSSIIHDLPNAQNAVQEQSYFTCPLCLAVFRCEDFTSHLANHANINDSVANTNLNSPNIPHLPMNTTSKDEQRGYTCKVCKYTTCDRKAINEHISFYHLSQFQPPTNSVPPNNSEPVHQVDLTVSVNDRITPNTVPPFKCSLCTNYQYSTIEELAQHFQLVHHSIIRKDIYHPYVCHFCFHPFQTYNELIIHTNLHQNTGWS